MHSNFVNQSGLQGASLPLLLLHSIRARSEFLMGEYDAFGPGAQREASFRRFEGNETNIGFRFIEL